MEFDIRDLPTRKNLIDMADKVRALDVSAVETMLLFIRVATNVYHEIYDRLLKYGLSQGKFKILMILFNDNESAFLPSELADKACITRATVTGLLDGLERDGIVERRIHPNDRRMVMTRITEKGIGLLQEVLPDHFIRISQLMSNLSEKDRETLVSMIEKVSLGISEIRQKDDV